MFKTEDAILNASRTRLSPPLKTPKGDLARFSGVTGAVNPFSSGMSSISAFPLYSSSEKSEETSSSFELILSDHIRFTVDKTHLQDMS